MILANGINMKPQINLWFLRTHDSTIYGNDNFSKFFPRGTRRWDDFKLFFCIDGTLTDTKYYAETNYFFNVRRMLQNLQRNFDLYWYPAWDLSTNEKTTGFQGRQNDKIQIRFKYAGDDFQYDDICDHGYTYSLIYRNDDISDSKNYLCATSERVIWILKLRKTEWNHVYMDNLYNTLNLCR